LVLLSWGGPGSIGPGRRTLRPGPRGGGRGRGPLSGGPDGGAGVSGCERPGSYGSAWTCGPTASDQALPAVASQLVDQVIAPRRPGYVFDGLKVPQFVPRVRQSRALLTTDGET